MSSDSTDVVEALERFKNAVKALAADMEAWGDAYARDGSQNLNTSRLRAIMVASAEESSASTQALVEVREGLDEASASDGAAAEVG